MKSKNQKMKSKAVLYIAGEGGHLTQMKRLIFRIQNEENINKNVRNILLTEVETQIEYFDEIVYIKNMRDKIDRKKTLSNILPVLKNNFSLIKNLKNKYNIELVISTGPGICILPSLYYKLKKKQIIYFETWCRFEKLSLTGKIMKHIADIFYIQNKELCSKNKKSIYCGLL